MSDNIPQRILCFNGGGVKGYSSLLILNDLWLHTQDLLGYLRDQFEENGYGHLFSENFRPCEFFTIIGGTSTGAIIAVLLGELQMTIAECIEAYKELSKDVFTISIIGWILRLPTKRRSLYSSSKFRKVVEKFLDRYSKPGACGKDRRLWSSGEPNGICKTIIITVEKHKNKSKVILLRSWAQSDGGPENGWGLVDAILAATAAPVYFPPHKVQGLDGYRYVDAAADGYNNPAQLLLEESRRLTGQHLQEALFIDIGTGKHGESEHSATGVRAYCKRFKNIITNCEPPSTAVRAQLGEAYFRFCVETGMEDIHVPDYKKLGEIFKVTKTYCESQVKRDYLAIAKKVGDICLGNYKPILCSCNVGKSQARGCLTDPESWLILQSQVPEEIIPYTLRNHSGIADQLKKAVASIGISSTVANIVLQPIKKISLLMSIESIEQALEVLKNPSDRETSSSRANDQRIQELVQVVAYLCWAWNKVNPHDAKNSNLEKHFRGLLRFANMKRTICDSQGKFSICEKLSQKETEIVSQSLKGSVSDKGRTKPVTGRSFRK